jgi:transcriptional regulator with XRE-family HTH domain
MRKRRAKLRLTQEEAAERAGISRQTWNGIEKGRRGVGAVNAERIAKVLGGKPTDYLSRPIPADELAEVRRRLAALERRIGRLEE